jgi:small subunit ribosomal protein S6
LKVYESIFIVDGRVPDDEVDKLIERFKQIILTHKGEVIKVEKLGKRELAYKIKGVEVGNYVCLEISSGAEGIAELERNYKITDSVLRHLTVKKVIPKQIKEKERKKEKKIDSSVVKEEQSSSGI